MRKLIQSCAFILCFVLSLSSCSKEDIASSEETFADTALTTEIDEGPVRISLQKSTLELVPGYTWSFDAKITGKTSSSILWSSSNSAVVEIDRSGKIAALKEGVSIIKAKVGDAQSKCTVIVRSRTCSD